jgi:hypothetical protein
LKLPQLLSQYLYQTRKLDLPGIGSFTLDAEAVIPQETDKIGQMPATGIQFKNVTVAIADDALINFIKEHTGKMKSLAASDLDFFLTTGRQLLNIGKPFYLEGIGTLVKNKDGRLDFTPGEYMIARIDTPGHSGHSSHSGHHQAAVRDVTDEGPRERESRSNSDRQILVLIGIVVGLLIIGGGGYYLYKRNSFSEPTAEKQAVVIPDTTSARQDTTAVKPDATAAANPSASDSVAGSKAVQPQSTKAAGATTTAATPAAPTPSAPTPSVTTPAAATANVPVPPGAILYHFVILSTDNKHHALRRYNQLLGYQLNIKMDQKDSTWFKLYFPIAALTRDTTYIKDSLSDTYAAPKVTIEH